ncbi:MAG: hypothetical protein AAF495_03300 [Pseudomonadota bacterium]
MIDRKCISLPAAHPRSDRAASDNDENSSAEEDMKKVLESPLAKAAIGRMWDEGLASGRADPDETIADIKRRARLSRPV